ncbi:MAG: hypothetical protein ACXWWU_10790 [Candidatus Limnocylindria bacterium]
MRQRFRPLRDRSMAERPGGERRLTLSGRQRLIAGWLAAIAVILVIAIGVQFLGGDGDGSPLVPSPSASEGGASPAAIAFGTSLDPTSGEVPEGSRATRFAAGDTFAYSVPAEGEPPSTVYVEVERVGGGVLGVVQEAATDGMQQVPAGRPAIGFTVPTANLLEVFGPGEYVMRIHLDPAADPIAVGSFVLVGEPTATPSGSPSGS